MSHTPEPWKAEGQVLETEALEPLQIALTTLEDGCSTAEAHDNAARIVACVNGCAGLNPAAYRKCIEVLEATKVALQLTNLHTDKAWHHIYDATTAALAAAQEVK